MKFQAKQFCSGYMYFIFEADNVTQAQTIIDQVNNGEEVDAIMCEDHFEADDGGDMRLVT